eukprot:3802578-Pyramimonas_sp.AAC.1
MGSRSPYPTIGGVLLFSHASASDPPLAPHSSPLLLLPSVTHHLHSDSLTLRLAHSQGHSYSSSLARVITFRHLYSL